MSFLAKILRSVATSILASLIIFIASYSLLTGEFPPNFSHLKNIYSTLKQLKSFNQKIATNPSGLDSGTDAEVSELVGYRNQMAQLEQQIASVVDEKTAVKSETKKQKAPEPLTAASAAPESYSGVAQKVREETERSQKNTQSAVQLQQLKDEVEKLKAENVLLRQKLSRQAQH